MIVGGGFGGLKLAQVAIQQGNLLGANLKRFLRSILGVRNKFIVFFNWMINYFSYGQSLRLILYAKKAKEVIDREERLAQMHQ